MQLYADCSTLVHPFRHPNEEKNGWKLFLAAPQVNLKIIHLQFTCERDAQTGADVAVYDSTSVAHSPPYCVGCWTVGVVIDGHLAQLVSDEHANFFKNTTAYRDILISIRQSPPIRIRPETEIWEKDRTHRMVVKNEVMARHMFNTLWCWMLLTVKRFSKLLLLHSLRIFSPYASTPIAYYCFRVLQIAANSFVVFHTKSSYNPHQILRCVIVYFVRLHWAYERIYCQIIGPIQNVFCYVPILPRRVARMCIIISGESSCRFVSLQSLRVFSVVCAGANEDDVSVCVCRVSCVTTHVWVRDDREPHEIIMAFRVLYALWNPFTSWL